VCIPVADEPMDLIEENIRSIKKNVLYDNMVICIVENSKNKSHMIDVIKFCKENNVYIYDIPNLGNKAKALNSFIFNELNTEYLVVIDVDQKVKKDFVTDIIKYFVRDIVLIQTPQCFENEKQNLLTYLYCKMQFVFTRICIGLNVMGYGFCLGSNFIVKTDTIKKIGGFDELCVIEDIATSYKISENGDRILFVDDVFFCGLSPDNIKSYIIQSERYFIGNLQLLIFIVKNIFALRIKFLTKIIYIFFTSSYMVAIMVLLINIYSLHINNVIFNTLLSVIILGLTVLIYNKFVLNLLFGSLFFIASVPLYVYYFIKYVFSKKKVTFKVTPKKRRQ
jgi:cellulose synthase/poly-beta-1,6-N-acetylglucosamine synthase-like glycosyltransferase